MKHTNLKLNPMPKRKRKPPSLDDKKLIILCHPENGIVWDTIKRADEVDWATRKATHFSVITTY